MYIFIHIYKHVDDIPKACLFFFYKSHRFKRQVLRFHLYT